MTVVVSRSVVVSRVGATGAQGPAGTQQFGPFTAAENIGSSSLVHVSSSGAYKADASLNRPAHGFTISAVTSGQSFSPVRSGSLNGLTGKTKGAKQYLHTNGLTTETPPTSGTLQVIGVAEATDEVFVDPELPITLA